MWNVQCFSSCDKRELIEPHSCRQCCEIGWSVTPSSMRKNRMENFKTTVAQRVVRNHRLRLVYLCILSSRGRIIQSDIRLTLSDPMSGLIQYYDFPLPLRCRVTSDTFFCYVCAPAPLPEPVRRFSSCSMDFSQQLAQVTTLLFPVRPCVLL